MNILTLYLSRFDDPTTQDEIVQVLSVMSAIGSMCSRPISSGAELTNVVTYLYGARSLRIYRFPRFSCPCQVPYRSATLDRRIDRRRPRTQRI